MGMGVLQLVPVLFAFAIYALPILVAVWIFKVMKDMRDTQQQMAAHIEAIARIVTKNDASH